MSLKHAILATLSHSDRSGYELTRKMDGSIGHFWPSTHQQIYLELKKLDALGFVKFKEKKQKGRPNKKIYSITKSGLTELKNWIREPTEVSPSRDVLLIKLFAGHLVDQEAIVNELHRHRELHQAKLTEYREIENTCFRGKRMPSHLLSQYFTLRRGILFEESWLKWCEECLTRLDA